MSPPGRKETGRAKADRRHQGEPAQNNYQSAREIQPKNRLRDTALHAFIQRKSRAVLFAIVKRMVSFHWRQRDSAERGIHEMFPVRRSLINGKLTIRFYNRNKTALLFPLDEGMEVLYREGGFGLNFARGLVIILCCSP